MNSVCLTVRSNLKKRVQERSAALINISLVIKEKLHDIVTSAVKKEFLSTGALINLILILRCMMD